MKKVFVKPEIKSLRLRENILAGSGMDVAGSGADNWRLRNQCIESGGGVRDCA